MFTPRPKFGEQTPPAIYPPILGAFGLGLAWRAAADVFPVTGAPGDLILGAVTLVYLFCLAAYGLKLARRPGVLPEDLRVLPGRAGLSSAVLSVYLLAAALVPIAGPLARVLLWAGLVLHLVLAGLVLRWFVSGPPEQRAVTPVWHLQFAGFILAAPAAAALDDHGLALALLYATGAVALGIWAVSAVQLVRRGVPPPLRPLLAIHLAPACVLGIVAAMSGKPWLALALAAGAVLIFAALVLRLRWILAAGFSPLWGAFTFPLAAFAALMLTLAAFDPALAVVRAVAGGALVLATLVIPPIAVKVLQVWARGELGARSNAARV